MDNGKTWKLLLFGKLMVNFTCNIFVGDNFNDGNSILPGNNKENLWNNANIIIFNYMGPINQMTTNKCDYALKPGDEKWGIQIFVSAQQVLQ